VPYAFVDGEEGEIVGSVALKLVANDYAVLRKFRGGSALGTYLNTVTRNQCRDHVGRLWGRWQPSTRARKLGPLAVELEKLTKRDGHTQREAIETLRSRTQDAPSEEALEALALALPTRTAKPLAASGVPPVDTLVRQETLAMLSRCRRALGDAIGALDDVERDILALRFTDSLAVSAIAVRLGLPLRPLYRRLERILRKLARALEARGFRGDAVLSAVALAVEEGTEPATPIGMSFD